MNEDASRDDKSGVTNPNERFVLSRWSRSIGLAFLFVAALIACVAGAPYLFKGATLESELSRQLRATTGLAFSAAKPGRFALLPRPHVAVATLHVEDPNGTLNIDAESLVGDVRLLPLIVGRIELSSATLFAPRLRIDLDGKPMQPDSLIGRAMRAEEPARSDGTQRLGTITLVDGTAIIKSKAFPHAPKIEAINATLDWRDLESPATLTGSMLIHKAPADIAAWIAQPSSLMRGDHSAIAFRIHSAPIDVSASGDVTTAATTSFHGHVSAKAPSATALIDLIGDDASHLAPFANLTLDSDASIASGRQDAAVVDLPNLTLRVDGNEYEGTLAFQTGARPSLSGTLATEQLMLAPFVNRLPTLLDTQRQWSTTPLVGRTPQVADLDLRISATHMRLASFTVDDAALAIMTRSDRTEVTLVEGKAYGGTAKGRFSIGVSRDGVSLRGTGSLIDSDASALTWDAFGRQILTGTISTSLSLETEGSSPAGLMSNLRGWAKGGAKDGEIADIDIGRGLREFRSNNVAALINALRSGRTPFQTLSFNTQIYAGIATVDDSTIKGPDATLAIGGNGDIGARRWDLDAVATAPRAATTKSADPKPAPDLRLNVKGTFDTPILAPDIAAAAPPKK